MVSPDAVWDTPVSSQSLHNGGPANPFEIANTTKWDTDSSTIPKKIGMDGVVWKTHVHPKISTLHTNHTV